MAAMSTPRRPPLRTELAHRAAEQLLALGREVRASRVRRRWTQAHLGGLVGVTQSTISQLERGHGGTLSLDLWQRVFLILGRPLRWEAGRDPQQDVADAGHLELQELVLRLGPRVGFVGTFEMPMGSGGSRHSTDVGLRDDRRRILGLIECWNAPDDLGAAARSSASKVARAEEVAIAIGHGEPYRVASCWVVRATTRNRRLFAKYEASLRSRFPGSSSAWVRALTVPGALVPDQPGIVWCDVRATRLFAWRSHRPHR